MAKWGEGESWLMNFWRKDFVLEKSLQKTRKKSKQLEFLENDSAIVDFFEIYWLFISIDLYASYK